jgi:hypothetical protein
MFRNNYSIPKIRPYKCSNSDSSTGTDTVEGGIGDILTQIDNNRKFHGISYASKQLIKHEKNYSPFLLEIDSIVWAI